MFESLELMNGISHFLHDIQLTSPYQSYLRRCLQNPEKKYIFTNSTRYHAGRILHHLNVHDYFEDIIDVSMINPYTKFERAAFPIALRLIGNPPPGECVMVDDEEEIIERALEEGLQGILVNQNPQQNGHNHVQIPSINHLDRALLQLSEKYSSSHQNEI